MSEAKSEFYDEVSEQVSVEEVVDEGGDDEAIEDD